MLHVRVPAHARHPIHLHPVTLPVEPVGRGVLEIFGHPEVHAPVEVGGPQPHPIGPDQRERLAVGDRVDAPDDGEPLAPGHGPRQELPKEGEGRVGDDDVRGVAQGRHLRAAEVAVPLEVVPLQVVDVDPSVAVGVAVEGEDLPMQPRPRRAEARAARLEDGRLPGGPCTACSPARSSC